MDRVNQALCSAKRTRHIRALLFLDSDNFKTANDQHGHEPGDLLLKEIAARLRATVREVDTVARISGDEFVVMLENLGTDPIEVTNRTRMYEAKKAGRNTFRMFEPVPQTGLL